MSGATAIKQDVNMLINKSKGSLELMKKKSFTMNIVRRAEELAEKHIYDSNLKF